MSKAESQKGVHDSGHRESGRPNENVGNDAETMETPVTASMEVLPADQTEKADVCMEDTPTTQGPQGVTGTSTQDGPDAEQGKETGQSTPPSNPGRTQISYKAKLLGQDSEATEDRDLAQLMKTWLEEEEETAPALSEDQKKMMETLPKLDINDDKLRELCRPWKDALILTLLGRDPPLQMMKDRLAWLLKSSLFELIDLPNNYFIFRYADMELRRRLLFDGPWLIQGHYLAVQCWSLNFNPYCNIVRKVAIWVRVPTLPIHVYAEECL